MRQARAAVAVAQRVSTLVAVESLCDALDVGLAGPKDAGLIERLVTSLEETARSLMQAMIDTLANSLDNSARFGLWGHRATQMVDRLCDAYDVLLGQPRDEVRNDLLTGACYWYARRLLLVRLAGDELQDPPLRLLLQALRGKNTLLPPAEAIPEPLRIALAELLLLNIALRRLPEPGQCLACDELMPELAPLLRLAHRFSRETPFVLLLENHGLPQQLQGWQMVDEDGISLFCDLNPVVQRLDERCRMVMAGEPLPEADAPGSDSRTLMRAAILQHVRLALSLYVEESFGNGIPEHTTLAAFDFLRIRVLLSNPTRQAPKREQLIREAEVLQVSEEGADLLLDADADCARLNGLLALYTGGQWWICVVRRLLREADGRLFAGARIVSRSPVAARFLHMEEGERNVLGHVIYLPEARPDKARLLMAQLNVEVDRDYVLDLERQERRVHIDRLLASGEGFALVAGTFLLAGAEQPC